MHEPFKRARGWAAAALLVLLAGLVPRAALAGCGDYVIFTGAAMEHSLASDSPSASHNSSLPTDHRPAMPLPCRGPRCSGQPTTPPAPPAPVQIQQRSETPAMTASSSTTFARQRSSWALEDIVPRPLEIVSSIFHPPRLSA